MNDKKANKHFSTSIISFENVDTASGYAQI